MSVLVFAKDLVAFPTAWFSGEEYKDVKEKARDFIYSTSRVVIACGIVWGLYKGQQCEPLRSLAVPVRFFSARVGKIIFSLEPLSLLINLFLIKMADSHRSQWIIGGCSGAMEVGHCALQTMRRWTREESSFFSATMQRVVLKIDLLSHLMWIALWKLPESRLGIGLFTTIFGLYQMNVYTIERWNLRDAPTQWALKGIIHIAFGLYWIGAYERYNDELEKSRDKEATYLYRVATWASPHLAWIATGERE